MSAAPSGRIMSGYVFHGLRFVRLRRTALHPWLQPAAPSGRRSDQAGSPCHDEAGSFQQAYFILNVGDLIGGQSLFLIPVQLVIHAQRHLILFDGGGAIGEIGEGFGIVQSQGDVVRIELEGRGEIVANQVAIRLRLAQF